MRQGVMLAHIWAEKNGEGINGQVLDFEGGAEDSENSNSKTQQKQKIPSISWQETCWNDTCLDTP